MAQFAFIGVFSLFLVQTCELILLLIALIVMIFFSIGFCLDPRICDSKISFTYDTEDLSVALSVMNVFTHDPQSCAFTCFSIDDCFTAIYDPVKRLCKMYKDNDTICEKSAVRTTELEATKPVKLACMKCTIPPRDS